jgi:hypothetical protein
MTATSKLSQITTTTPNPATTDYAVSVLSGSTDMLVTYSQVATTVSPIITLVSSQVPVINIAASSITTSLASSQIPTISINASSVTTGTLSTAVLPVATTSAQGIVSIGSGLTVGSGTTAVSTALSVSTLVVTSSGTVTGPSIGVGSASTGFYSSGSTGFGISINGVNKLDYGITVASQVSTPGTFNANVLASTAGVAISANTGVITFRNSSTQILSPGSNVFQIGPLATSTPSAQTLQFQSGSGTNITGVNTAIIGSLGTGNTTSGNIVFQVGGATGASGTTPATATTAMTIMAVTRKVSHTAPVTLPLYTVSSAAALSGSATGDVAVVTDALAPTFLGTLTGGGTSVVVVVFNGTSWVAS